MPSIKKIIILGCGLVGKTIAIDLCRDYNVTVADADQARLEETQKNNPVRILQTDLSIKPNLSRIVADFDLVIGALPGHMGFETLKTVIEAGKNVVDISFFAEDPFLLDELAKTKNVTAVVDSGVSPGISNILLGYHNKRTKIKSYEVYVGGLPLYPKAPFKYKAPFSPADVIEEYLRPARIVKDGKVVVKEALSEPELINFGKAGTLEAFFTDGLRTLLRTMKIPDMIEKTLRYPGHVDIIKMLRDSGFLSGKPIEINGSSIRPIDYSSRILFPHWKMEEGEKEFTVLRMIITDEENEIVYNLYDEYDDETNTTSMSRTTGYNCSAVARLVLEDNFKQKGICPPEFIGEDEDAKNEVINYLEQRKIRIDKTESSL